MIVFFFFYGGNGFVFLLNKKEIFNHKAAKPLGTELSIPWILKPTQTKINSTPASSRLSALQHYLAVASTKSSKQKQKQLKQSVHKLATRLHEDYLKKCQNKPRGLALKLIKLVEKNER